MKARTQSRAGNPIRRPPPSGGEEGGGGSSGYASSSGYSSSSGYASSSEIDHVVGRASSSASSASSFPSSFPSASASAPDPGERARLARALLALACLWPLLFLLVPPGAASRSHVALLSAGSMDTVDSQSLSQHIRHVERRAHEGIDRLRSRTAEGSLRLREEMRSLLRRKDVVGYGPSRPRVAAVVVVPSPPPSPSQGKSQSLEDQMLLDGALEAVESIFRTTDRNRVFVVAVVVDGRGKLGSFESRLRDIDAGRTAHRHGDEVHTHDHHRGWKERGNDEEENEKGRREHEDDKEEEVHAHSEKIHAIYNHEAMGVGASRKEGARFANILAGKHEEAGLKSPEEDLILLFLRCDARLRDPEGLGHGGRGRRTWLDDVTDALILAPPEEDPAADLLGGNGNRRRDDRATGTGRGSSDVPGTSPPANAVSFAVDYSSADAEGNVDVHPSPAGETLAFDGSLRPARATATAQQMSLSDGESYPAPVTHVATALRLRAYDALPASDAELTNHYSADLELSFNLWLCADGIDTLASGSARVVVDPEVLSPFEKSKLPGPLAARIVGAWMSGHDDEEFSSGILREVAAASAAAYMSRKNMGRDDKDHAMSERRELSDKVQTLNHALVRIASEAKLSASFPVGLAKKCRPFSWYAQLVLPRIDFLQEGGGEGGDSGGASDERDGAKLSPLKPLDKGRMEIISRASPVNLAYVDISEGHTAHPHRGATDEQGNFGYIHDEEQLHRDSPTFEIKDEKDHAKLCMRGDPNYTMLTEKVFVDLTSDEAAQKRAEHGLSRTRRAKIFCLVYTTEKNHYRIPAIRETWGQKCDGFMVASTKTDKSLGTVNIPHEGPEEYNNIWQKVRSMWSYVYDNYYEKYDYYHIGGDDLYLIVENLRLYLESEEIKLASNGGRDLPPEGTQTSQVPLFMGRRFAEGGNRHRMFISGGSGYTLNKAALKTLVVDGLPHCTPHMKTFSEDVMIANCFRGLDVLPYDTKDEAGGERYMPFQPGHHLTYRPPKNIKDDWYSNYSVDVKWGIDHCAAKSVAFHYIKEDLMRRMHAILYHYC